MPKKTVNRFNPQIQSRETAPVLEKSAPAQCPLCSRELGKVVAERFNKTYYKCKGCSYSWTEKS